MQRYIDKLEFLANFIFILKPFLYYLTSKYIFHFYRIECKITPGMELFEQQYFPEQYIILTRTEEGHEKD